MKIRVWLFNILQVIKQPLYLIPYGYGRIIYGYSKYKALYVWKNRFFERMRDFYYKVDNFQVRLAHSILGK